MIKGARRLYLDANILIYFHEGHPEYGQAAGHLLKSASDAGVDICISDLCLAECLLGAKKQNKPAAVDAYQTMLDPSQKDFTFVELTSMVLEPVPDLAAEFGLKLVDAMHLSLALQAGCDAFATNDRGFDQAEAVIDLIGLD